MPETAVVHLVMVATDEGYESRRAFDSLAEAQDVAVGMKGRGHRAYVLSVPRTRAVDDFDLAADNHQLRAAIGKHRARLTTIAEDGSRGTEWAWDRELWRALYAFVLPEDENHRPSVADAMRATGWTDEMIGAAMDAAGGRPMTDNARAGSIHNARGGSDA